MPILSRPKTPPLPLELSNEQLLTPPSTGGFKRKVTFAQELAAPASKRLADSQSVDAASFDNCTELSLLSEDSQGTNVSGIDWDRSGSLSPPATPETPAWKFTTNNGGAATCLAISSETPAVIQPFPFLKLPLTVRNRIYEILLVIPALICVRQNHTAYHKDKGFYLHPARPKLLPGIAYALAQLTVDGFKFRFARFRSSNVGILRASEDVFAEARAVMYGGNNFEIVCPNSEFSPPPDFETPLFPRGYQRNVQKLSIRTRAFYPLRWLMSGRYAELKNAYRGLETLTLIFEMQSAARGFGKRLSRKENELWTSYVRRIHSILKLELFGAASNVKSIPVWIEFRVLFDGDRYDVVSDIGDCGLAGIGTDLDNNTEEVRRRHLKSGLAEAYELFKKGGC